MSVLLCGYCFFYRKYCKSELEGVEFSLALSFEIKLAALTSGTLLDTNGSPARGAGSNCKLRNRIELANVVPKGSDVDKTHKVYLRFSSISIMAA